MMGMFGLRDATLNSLQATADRLGAQGIR